MFALSPTSLQEASKLLGYRQLENPLRWSRGWSTYLLWHLGAGFRLAGAHVGSGCSSARSRKEHLPWKGDCRHLEDEIVPVARHLCGDPLAAGRHPGLCRL